MSIQEREVAHDGIVTTYLDVGSGSPVLLIHGSGPGVSARANWHSTLESDMTKQFRFLAPDVVGFGGTRTAENFAFTQKARIDHMVQFMDKMGIEKFSIIGNSMGGSVALAMAHRHPDRVTRMVLMGAVGIKFAITPLLDEIWGYTPSLDSMRSVLESFAWDKSIITDQLVKLRYEASKQPGILERYHAAFTAPRQRHLDDMALEDEEIATIRTPTLLVHGADDNIIPLEQTSLRMVRLLKNADLVVLGRCGHWTQIERGDEFRRQVGSFLARTN